MLYGCKRNNYCILLALISSVCRGVFIQESIIPLNIGEAIISPTGEHRLDIDTSNRMTLYDTKTNNTIEHYEDVINHSCGFSPKGTYFFLKKRDRGLEIHKSQDGSLFQHFYSSNSIQAIPFNDDETMILDEDYLYDLEKKTKLCPVHPMNQFISGTSKIGLILSKDHNENIACTYDYKSSVRENIKSISTCYNHTSFSSYGDALIAWKLYGDICIYNLSTQDRKKKRTVLNIEDFIKNITCKSLDHLLILYDRKEKWRAINPITGTQIWKSPKDSSNFTLSNHENFAAFTTKDSPTVATVYNFSTQRSQNIETHSAIKTITISNDETSLILATEKGIETWKYFEPMKENLHSLQGKQTLTDVVFNN